MGLCKGKGKGTFSPLCALGLIITVMGHAAYSQDSPADYLKVHNAARSEVGVPPLTWDDTVAAFALNYAKQHERTCELEHSGDDRYGENLAGSGGDFNGDDAVRMWVGEKPYYRYDSNSCVGGECLHYTQVVWRNSTRLGCAKVRCHNGGTFIGCNYDPPGNYVGERPY